MDINIFKLLVDTVPQPVWIKDKGLNFIYVNKEYKTRNKIEEDKIIGLCEEQLYNKKIADRCNEICSKAIESKSVIKEKRYINDGIQVESIVFPLINSNGDIDGIAGIDQEIVNEETDILKVVMDSLPGRVFYKDRNLKYVYTNKNFEDLFEISSKEIIGKSNTIINKSIGKMSNKFTKDDKEVIRTKRNVITEEKFELENGQEVYTEIIRTPVMDCDNEVKGIVGLSIDITRKKEMEKRLKYLSYNDNLTKVYNRTCFEEKAKEILKQENLPIGVIMGDTNGLKIVNDTLGHEEGDELLRLTTQVLKDVCSDKESIFRIGGDEFAIIIPNTTDYECENLIKRILNTCKNYKHDLIDISIALGFSMTYSLDKSIYQTLKEAEDIVYRKKLLEKNSLNSSVILSLQATLEEKSLETEEHTERVVENAMNIGEILSLPLSVMDELILVAKLHDIGKIGINESILLKSNDLTEEEFEIIKSHADKGYRIIKAATHLESVAKGVLSHHERWDGTGYPIGLKGEEIPLIARIVSIADAYDVMTSNTSYKNALTKDQAIEELVKNSGKQFDPDIVEIFVKSLKDE